MLWYLQTHFATHFKLLPMMTAAMLKLLTVEKFAGGQSQTINKRLAHELLFCYQI